MKKIKIETILSDGSKVVVSLNSPINKKKLENFLMLINLLDSGSANLSEGSLVTKSIYEKVKYLVEKYFSNKVFTLSEFMRTYSEVYGGSLKKSTLSTYLSRLVDEGILLREGFRGNYHYRYIGSIVKIGEG